MTVHDNTLDLLGSNPPFSYTIQDSGQRTQFATGAVRDIQAGKGRCDLLPPRAILRLARHFEAGAVKYGERNWEKGIPINSFVDSGLRHILRYMAGETDKDHLCAAAWNLTCAMELEERFGYEFDRGQAQIIVQGPEVTE
jgi:hypothetical protein